MSDDLLNRARTLLTQHRNAYHRFPEGMDDEVLAWKCTYCHQWQRDDEPLTICPDAPPPTRVVAPIALIEGLIALAEEGR